MKISVPKRKPTYVGVVFVFVLSIDLCQCVDGSLAVSVYTSVRINDTNVESDELC